MAGYRVASRIALKDVQVISVVVDVARLGKPAKEWILGFAGNVGLGKHVSMPPQVLMRRTVRATKLLNIPTCLNQTYKIGTYIFF